MNDQTLQEWEDRARLETFLHVSHSLALIAEVRRLREALESIEGGHPCDEEHREIARAALIIRDAQTAARPLRL